MGVKGYFLFRGDKTVCGGKILEGCTDHQFFDKDMACEGHKVTCGIKNRVTFVHPMLT